MEERLAYLTYVAGVDVTALRTASDETLVELVHEARRAKDLLEDTPPNNIRKWAELFIQFSELEILRLARLMASPRPWEPLYVLCISMQEELRRRSSFNRPSMQDLYRLLERGRRSLGKAIVLTHEVLASETGTPATRRLLLMDSVDRALLRLIEADPVVR